MGKRLFGRALPLGQLGDLCRNLAGFLCTGVPMVQALDLLAATGGMPKASRRACRLLARELRQGRLLPDAMQRLDPLFPQTLVAAVRGADGHGNLAAALTRMGRQYSRREEQQRQLLAGMAYPALLACMVFAVAWLATTWLLPQLTPLLTATDTLPAATRLLLEGGALLQTQGGALAAGAVVLLAVLRVVWGLPGVRTLCDRIALHLPLTGRSRRQIVSARFARTLADLYACGTPLLPAISLAAETTGNSWICRQARGAIRAAETGADWSQAIGKMDGFTPQLALCLRVGSQNGTLKEQLEATADVMDSQNAFASKQMLNLLEPISVVALGGVVLVLMSAVMLPLYQYYDALWTLY